MEKREATTMKKWEIPTIVELPTVLTKAGGTKPNTIDGSIYVGGEFHWTVDPLS